MASNYASYSPQYHPNYIPYGYSPRSPLPNEHIRARSHSYNDLSAFNGQAAQYLPKSPAFQYGPNNSASYLSRPMTNRSNMAASNSAIAPGSNTVVGQPPANNAGSPPATLSRYRGKHLRAASMNAAQEDPTQPRLNGRYRNSAYNASISSSEISVDSESLQTQTSVSSVGSINSSQSWADENTKLNIPRSFSHDKPMLFTEEPPLITVSGAELSTRNTIRPVATKESPNGPAPVSLNEETVNDPADRSTLPKPEAITSAPNTMSRSSGSAELMKRDTQARSLSTAQEERTPTARKHADNQSLPNPPSTTLVLPSDRVPKAVSAGRSKHELPPSERMPSIDDAYSGNGTGSISTTAVSAPTPSISGLRAPKIAHTVVANRPAPARTTSGVSRVNDTKNTAQPSSTFMNRQYKERADRSISASMPPGSILSGSSSAKSFVVDTGIANTLPREPKTSVRTSRSFSARLKDFLGSNKSRNGSKKTTSSKEIEPDDDARSTMSSRSAFSIRSATSFMSIGGKLRRKKNESNQVTDIDLVDKSLPTTQTVRSSQNGSRSMQGAPVQQQHNKSTNDFAFEKAESYHHAPPPKMEDGFGSNEEILPPQAALRSTISGNTSSSRSESPVDESEEAHSRGLRDEEDLGLAPPNLSVGDIFPGSLKSENVETIVSSVERTGSFKRQPSTSRRTEEEVVPNAQKIEVDAPSTASAQPKIKSALKSATGRNLRKRSGATTTESVSFASQILVYKTYSARDYDRTPDRMTCDMLHIPGVPARICAELDNCKESMPIHPDSAKYTHFFKKKNNQQTPQYGGFNHGHLAS